MGTTATAEILLLLLALVLAAAPRASEAQEGEDGVVGRVMLRAKSGLFPGQIPFDNPITCGV